MSDIIQQLGSLGFASRLKRLSERLLSDVSKVYKEQKVNFEARWFPVAFLLRDAERLSVTEIADRLQITHPAVSQIVGAMESHGLIASSRDMADERRRLLSLTPTGQETLQMLEPIWNAVSACTQELITSTGHNLLDLLSVIERSLDERDMYSRVTATIRQQQLDSIEIVEYSRRYREDFGRLNREWLEEYFEIEDHDAAVLDDPEGTILRFGGEIVFARHEGEIVGTAALLKGPNRHFELAKMAVTPRVRGRQIGRRLAEWAIARARKRGATQIVLATSPKLTAARELYHTLGFVEYEPEPVQRAQYKRCSVFMRLDLKPAADAVEQDDIGRRKPSNAQ